MPSHTSIGMNIGVMYQINNTNNKNNRGCRKLEYIKTINKNNCCGHCTKINKASERHI